MATITVGELLDCVVSIERRLTDLYEEIRRKTQDNGLCLLTYYLASHCRHLGYAFEALDEEQKNLVRGVELEVELPEHLENAFSAVAVKPAKITGSGLLNSSVAYRSGLMEMYRTILLLQLPAAARSIFEAVLRNEERDIKWMNKMRAMDFFER